MSKWWFIMNTFIVLAVTCVLFYFVANGALLAVATLPYIVWWSCFRTKKHYLMLPVAFFALISIFFVLPYVVDIYYYFESASFFVNLYSNLFPDGFSYSWFQMLPEQFWIMFSGMLALILWSKVLLHIIHRVVRKISRTNYLLALSCIFTTVLFVYTLVNIISLLFFVDIFAWFRLNIATALAYDILFVWLPFLIIYWFVEWFSVKVIQGKEF